MKSIIFFSISLVFILESNARLLARTTERAIVSKNDDFKTVSITKHCQHDHEKHDRKGRSFLEVSEKRTSNDFKRSIEKAKIPLVKKPIPMYVEINYEEEYQTRLVRWPKYRDSSENEDEDFNVDDYEFDVNHDEFAARGKPLEPRVRLDKSYANVRKETKSEGRTYLEMNINNRTDTEQTNNSNNRQESADKATVKSRKVKQDDYYDDYTTKVAEKVVKIVYSHEDVGDEVEDSKERGRRGSVRTIRSPWDIGNYMDKLGEKTALLVDKVLSILPMFPQIPQQKNVAK